MDFNEYQQLAAKTAIYRETSQMWLPRVMYCALGLASEAGEVAGQAKRIIRDDGGELNNARWRMIVEEIGDVLWYCAMLAQEIRVDLDTVAKQNLMKLRDRRQRGVIHGEGGGR